MALIGGLVPKPIDCALIRTVLGQALAVFQAFSLAKPWNLKAAFPKLKFWEGSALSNRSFTLTGL
jgi:hypothetical protein